MSIPRKHHFLPQVYLRSFLVNPKKQQLYVLDAKKSASYYASVADIAQQRDFNRIDIEGSDPNLVEKELSQFETRLANSIKNIVEGGPFIHETKEVILSFIALVAVRTPLMREHFSNIMLSSVNKILELSLQSEEIWNQSQKDFNDEKKMSFNEAKDFFESHKYSIAPTREYQINLELKLQNEIYQYLMPRNWQLVTLRGDSGYFLTSDNPVRLAWDNPEELPPFYRDSLGFAMKRTTVYFPLTKQHYLTGSFEKSAGYIDGNRELTALCNTQTVELSSRQVFSPNDKAIFQSGDGGFRAVKDIFV